MVRQKYPNFRLETNPYMIFPRRRHQDRINFILLSLSLPILAYAYHQFGKFPTIIRDLKIVETDYRILETRKRAYENLVLSNFKSEYI